METVKVLVTGCGSIGMRHLTVLASRPDVRIAVHDVDPERAEAVARVSREIPFFRDESAAFDWRPELVIVSNPNHCHRDSTLKAFSAGAQVLCEKPIAHDLEDGRAMVRAAAESGRMLMVGYTERYRPSFQFLEDRARNGDFGSLVGGRAMVGSYNTILCSRAAANNPNFGSIVVDFTHELDLLGSLFGNVREALAFSNQLGDKPGIACRPSLAAMLLRYESDAIVSVHMDYIQHPQRRILEVYGDRQSAEFDMQTNTVRIWDTRSDGHRTYHFPISRNEVFALEHEDAIRMAREGHPPRVDGAAALKVLETARLVIDRLR